MIDYVNQENLHQENPLLNLIETTYMIDYIHSQHSFDFLEYPTFSILSHR